MKKLFSTILVLTLLLSGNAYADKQIIIQCADDDPKIFLLPIYNINLENKKVKVGASSLYVLKYNENELILGEVTALYSEKMEIDRITGRYQKLQIFYGKSEEEKKVIKSSGICEKVEKAF